MKVTIEGTQEEFAGKLRAAAEAERNIAKELAGAKAPGPAAKRQGKAEGLELAAEMVGQWVQSPGESGNGTGPRDVTAELLGREAYHQD